jgi:NAD(P)-dependent dehydrogenase (short-subunit alcohol dehydrogenase family)
VANAEHGPSHVVVTGGSSGIGAAVTRLLLERSLKVTVFDLQPPSDSDAAFERVDVSDEAAVVAAMDAAELRSGVVTGLVSCHGIRGEFVPALELDLAVTRRVLEVHVLGTLSVSREMVRRLAGRAASIVTISSTTSYGGWANQSDYGVAKAAIRQLTSNLSIEWAPIAVRVNSVAPGFTLTPMVQQMIDDGYPIVETEKRTPLGRLATPEEMAGTIVYLLCDATYVTGQCLPVDGGWSVVGK